MGRFGGELVSDKTGGRFGGAIVDSTDVSPDPAQLSAIEPEKGFGERLGESLNDRAMEVFTTITAYRTGNISLPETMLQTGGKGIAGSALDIMGEAATTAGAEAWKALPEAVKEPITATAKEGWAELMESDVGKKATEAVNAGTKGWEAFKQDNPRAAKNIESAVNIGVLLAPPKVRANAKPTVLGKASEKLGKAAGKQIAKKRSEFIKDLVLPEKTPTVLKAEVARTKETGVGVFKRSVVTPTARESEVIKEVSKIIGVQHKKSAQQNYSAINTANTKLAKKLDADVAKSRAPITVSESSKAVDNAINLVVAENPIIVGNLQTTAIRVAKKAKEFISKNEPTPSGLLKARKEFDNWVRTLPRGEAKLAADAAMESQTIAIKTTRNAMNDLLDSKVKSTAVKQDLKRQSLLYDALENITPKAAKAANTAIGRAWQNTFKVLGIRNKAIQSAAAVMGVGGLGAAAQFAPVFTTAVAITGISGVVGKIVLGPTSKIFVGKFLKAIDKALLTSKNPSMIKQLRADRAVIVEMLKHAEIQEESEQQ